MIIIGIVGRKSIAIECAEFAQTDRLFDRQAWVGLETQYGELRVGRQNTLIFAPLALYQDFTYRSLGSLANSFSFPARLDDDIAYISPRMAGFKIEAHYSFESDDSAPATSGPGVATPGAWSWADRRCRCRS